MLEVMLTPSLAETPPGLRSVDTFCIRHSLCALPDAAREHRAPGDRDAGDKYDCGL
jgi:hypothetical protein